VNRSALAALAVLTNVQVSEPGWHEREHRRINWEHHDGRRLDDSR
jgi:hypothetical protein